MKFTRKLIPALAMLIVSATMMSTASFAWFSMNSTVTASGMKVQAAAPANLYIKDDFVAVSDCNDTAVTWTNGASTLTPTTLAFDANVLTAKYPQEWTTAPTPDTAGVASTFKTVGTLTCSKDGDIAKAENASEFTSYVVYEELTVVRKVQVTAAAAYDLKATVSVENVDNTVNIWKALRVGFLTSKDQGTTWNYANATEDATLVGTTATFTEIQLGENITDNTAFSVVLVVWYEGTDADCIANNALAIDELTIGVKFDSTDYHPAP